MCLLSFKMNNQSMEAVMELDHKDLFSKCVNRDKKSFYEFNDWIKAEVSRIRFKQVYQKNQRKTKGNKNKLKKFEATDGIKLVNEY